MTHFFTILRELNAYVTRNIFHDHLNVMICTSRILRQEKRKFEQIYSKFYETKALTSTFSKNMAELLNRTHGLWPQTSEPTISIHGYSHLRIIIQNLQKANLDFNWLQAAFFLQSKI